MCNLKFYYKHFFYKMLCLEKYKKYNETIFIIKYLL